MKKAIIGKKVGMTQIFDETGKVVPVTVIEAGPCKVVQKKSAEKEGYASVQLGFEEIPERKLNKPEKGHLDKAGVGHNELVFEIDYTQPQEVYDDPANLFVANFLGTPPINVFSGRVEGGKLFIGDDCVLTVGGLEDQAYPPPQVPPDRNKHFSQAEPHGGVPIVSARVHQTGPA